MQWISDLYVYLNDNIQIQWVSKLILVFIFLFALLLIPIILSLVLPFFKNILRGKSKVYLYAFSTGFFIILSIFGFLKESLEVSSFQGAINGYSSTQTYLTNIGLVAGGTLTGIIFSFVLKFVISFQLNKKLMSSKKLSIFIHQHEHSDHVHTHSHSDFMNNKDDKLSLVEDTLKEKVEGKLKLIALLLLLTHRIPEGLLIGYSLNQHIPVDGVIYSQNSALTTAYFLSLIFHLIPEETIFYLRLRESGLSPWKALFVSFIGLFLFLPFMLIGIYVGDFINSFLKSFIYAGIGGVFLFTSLAEFFPEFYHEIFNKKKWLITLIFLFMGVIFAVIILSFHTHSHGI